MTRHVKQNFVLNLKKTSNFTIRLVYSACDDVYVNEYHNFKKCILTSTLRPKELIYLHCLWLLLTDEYLTDCT